MNARRWIIVALAAAFASGTALAHESGGAGADAHAAHVAPAAAAAAPAVQRLAGTGTHDARSYFTDTEVLDQDGRSLRFYSDVLEGRVVVLNVVFTSCEDACPLITRKLKEVRDGLGERAKDVHFISISSDPERDSPQALKAFARKNDADVPNWTFLTGSRAAIDTVLGRLGQLSRSPEEHSTLLIAGDVGNKRWNKIRPDAPPAAIVERLRLLTEPVAASGL